MKRWIGRWMIGTSILHTLFAIIVFWDGWITIVENGIFDTVKQDFVMGTTVFFFLWGLLYFVFGLVIDALEKKEISPLPKSLGWGLLIHAIIAVVLVPKSGFWLLFPPAVAIIMNKKIKNDN